MTYITPQQMQELDRLAQEKYGIASLILMENAGRGVALTAQQMLTRAKKKRILCVCGKGNNGGDGFVAARHLINSGYRVDVVLVDHASELKHDAKIQYDILTMMDVKIFCLEDHALVYVLKKLLKRSGLVIDAIFGIGLSGHVRYPYDAIIQAVNGAHQPILAVDVPSGLDALTGKRLGVCIRAKVTVTFAYPKIGFKKNDGPDMVGRLIVCDISIPKNLLSRL